MAEAGSGFDGDRGAAADARTGLSKSTVGVEAQPLHPENHGRHREIDSTTSEFNTLPGCGTSADRHRARKRDRPLAVDPTKATNCCYSSGSSYTDEGAIMRILVSGAGTAGLSAGIDLARAGHEVEIVERANHLRVNGSPIDVRGAAIETARSMGILDAVHEHRITMTEQTTFIDRSGRAVARLAGQEIDDSPDDIELPREDLVTILRRNLPAQVDLRFEESIATLADDGDRVVVTFACGREAAYDIVVGADGVHSAVRRLVFGPEEEFTEHLGVYVAIGDLPGQARSGTARMTQILNLPGRFAGVARYRDRALGIFEFRSEPIDYDHHDLDAQKRILAGAFAGIEDWKVPELVETARDDPNLYFDAIAQIIMPSWHRGRVVLIGDAAHCATPMAGRGVSLALLGAWTLTEELGRHGDDLASAFNAYERRQRPRAAAAQEFARGGADLMVPATWEAIEARNARLRAARPLLAESCSRTGSSPSHEGVVVHRTPSERAGHSSWPTR